MLQCLEFQGGGVVSVNNSDKDDVGWSCSRRRLHRERRKYLPNRSRTNCSANPHEYSPVCIRLTIGKHYRSLALYKCKRDLWGKFAFVMLKGRNKTHTPSGPSRQTEKKPEKYSSIQVRFGMLGGQMICWSILLEGEGGSSTTTTTTQHTNVKSESGSRIVVKGQKKKVFGPLCKLSVSKQFLFVLWLISRQNLKSGQELWRPHQKLHMLYIHALLHFSLDHGKVGISCTCAFFFERDRSANYD